LKIQKAIKMLLPDIIHPEDSIYYNGAIVLKLLQKQTHQNILDLYQTAKKERAMSFAVFVLCLDWLFLLNIAIVNQNGEVNLCS
jgi:hypothetical protein